MYQVARFLQTKCQAAFFDFLLQVVASKYMNDEGEMEALTNSDWAKLGKGNPLILKKNFFFSESFFF